MTPHSSHGLNESSILKRLNNLHKAINNECGFKIIRKYYAFKTYNPRVNLGPCGPFAKAFYEVWNILFDEKVTICFLFSSDRSICFHCFVKLPDGNFFDGGFGIYSAVKLLKKSPPGSFIEEMKIYDEMELERNAYGLNRAYAHCPNYNNENVYQIIKSHLTSLKNGTLMEEIICDKRVLFKIW